MAKTYKFNPFTGNFDCVLDTDVNDARNMKLDQTSRQTISGGIPLFSGGLDISKTSTKITAGGDYGENCFLVWNGASNSHALTRMTGISGGVETYSGNTKNLSFLYGLNFFMGHNGTATISTGRIMSIYASLQSGSITTLAGAEVYFLGDPNWVMGTSTSVPTYRGMHLYGDYSRCSFTNAYGIYIENLVNTGGSGGGTLTNQYGIYIQDQTSGGTSDYGIVIEGADTCAIWLGSGSAVTTAADGITFGSGKDVNLYRNATDLLRTDDTFQAAGYKSSDGSTGASGSFTSADGKTITVKNGLITSIA